MVGATVGRGVGTSVAARVGIGVLAVVAVGGTLVAVGAAVAVGGRLVFEVWDRDYATLDDFMGQARCAGPTPALQLNLSARARSNKQCMHVNN